MEETRGLSDDEGRHSDTLYELALQKQLGHLTQLADILLKHAEKGATRLEFGYVEESCFWNYTTAFYDETIEALKEKGLSVSAVSSPKTNKTNDGDGMRHRFAILCWGPEYDAS